MAGQTGSPGPGDTSNPPACKVNPLGDRPIEDKRGIPSADFNSCLHASNNTDAGSVLFWVSGVSHASEETILSSGSTNEAPDSRRVARPSGPPTK